jgi:hypothetical protein
MTPLHQPMGFLQTIKGALPSEWTTRPDSGVGEAVAAGAQSDGRKAEGGVALLKAGRNLEPSSPRPSYLSVAANFFRRRAFLISRVTMPPSVPSPNFGHSSSASITVMVLRASPRQSLT